MQQLLQLNDGEWQCTGGKTSNEWLSNFKPCGGLTVVNLLSLWCGCRMFFHRASLCARARTSHGDHRMSTCHLLRTRSACLLYLCRSFGRSRAIKTSDQATAVLHYNGRVRYRSWDATRKSESHSLSHSLTSAVTEESGDVRPPQNKSKNVSWVGVSEKLWGRKSTSIPNGRRHSKPRFASWLILGTKLSGTVFKRIQGSPPPPTPPPPPPYA